MKLQYPPSWIYKVGYWGSSNHHSFLVIVCVVEDSRIHIVRELQSDIPRCVFTEIGFASDPTPGS